MAHRVGVVLFPGSNCELDVIEAAGRLGADAEILWHGDASTNGVDTVVIPGGFAHGDYLRCGAIARFSPVMDAVAAHAAAGGTVVGICNGFQVLTEAGLLPGALQKNRGLKFLCTTVGLRVESTDSPLTRAATAGEVVRIPINHFEGNYTVDAETLARLRDEDRVVLRYVENPNGSADDIAGVCNEGRNVVGLMPHPERAIDELLGSSDGLRLLSGLVGATAPAARGRPVSGEAAVDPEVHRALGLTDDEFDTIVGILGRRPNHLELAMYSVMWSEHCSYKSSRVHLRRLPSEAPHVLVGPGEGAGVVDVGDGIGAALRIESHNHPSAIEPYQGAATGVGGILRDIFSMGARPIATMDPLRFGPLDDARSRWIAEGVVSGISGYGNSVGVPTVGGEVVFDETYAENPLVNVLCLGVLPVERLVLARASGVGNLAVLLGSSTGRDGIGGASVLASAGFGEGEDEQAKRPSVQVGDPFEEKRLIEACLELLDRRLAVGVQDLGAAGITGATSETASKGGSGLDVLLSEIPQREPGMAPYEVMISESQERMLAIVEPANVDEVLAIAAKWEIRASVIGVVNSSGRLRVLDRLDGEVLADIPASSLDSDAPLYHRPLAEPADLAARRARDVTAQLLQSAAVVDLTAALAPMLADTSWVYTQYDHQLFLNTVEAPGGDAAVLRLKHPTTGADTGRGLALTTDGNHRWCAVDPRQGTASVVAEAVLNLAVVGARPLALVNNLNFGNPEHPEVMWELSESIDGMAEACRVLGIPVIGGNVSLYNESRGRDIDPTPVVGVLGIVDRLERRPPGVRVVEGHRLLLSGSPTEANLAGSRFAADAGLPRAGTLPSLDLAAVAATAELVRSLVADGLVGGAHDVAEGGLAAALAELAIGGGVGISAARIHGAAELFSESPGRVVLSIAPEHLVEVEDRHTAAGVGCVRLGLATGDRLTVKGLLDVALAELTTGWRDALPNALGHGTTQG